MIALYVLAFCRVVVGLIFVVSSGSKALKLQEFQHTIIRFNILPKWLAVPAAIVFVCSEMAVALFIALGGQFLLPGFSLAIILLILFCGALVSVLVRRIPTSCNCFGSSESLASLTDVWRNLGFILCALVGCAAVAWTQKTQESLGKIEWILTAFGAVVFVMIWIQLGEIAKLFRRG